MAEQNTRNQTAGHVIIIVMNTFFGMLPPFTKAITNEGFHGLDIVALRACGACGLFWIASTIMKGEQVERKDILRLFLAAMMGIVLSQCLQFTGIQYTSPVHGGIIVTMGPVFTLLLSAIILGVGVTKKGVLGIVLALTGAVVITLTSNRGGGADGSILGDLLCLSATLSYAIYLVCFRRLLGKYSAFTINKWMFLFAALVTLPLSSVHLGSIEWNSLPASTYLQLAYIVFVCGFVCFLLLVEGQKRLSPHIVGTYMYIQPVVAIIVSLLMGIGVFGWLHAVAVTLVFIGVWLVIRQK